MLFRSLVAVLAGGLALETLASPLSLEGKREKRVVPSSHSVHERHLAHWSRKWSKKDKIPRNVMLPMRIGLAQRNLEAGHDRLMDISNPRSSNYGKHMTYDEVTEFFAPEQSTVDTVIDWLVASGISSDRIGQSVNKQWIQFDASTGEVEELLFAEFHVWEHSDGSSDVAAEMYHIPSHVQEHVDYITPGVRLRARGGEHPEDKKRDLEVRHSTKGNNNESKNKKRDLAHNTYIDPTLVPAFDITSVANSKNCSVYITADCIRVQYSIPNGTTSAAGNELGIFESLNDHYSRPDLDVFFATLYPYLDVPAGTYPEERLVDGAVGAIEDPNPYNATYPAELGLESSLDFDASWPLIWPQKTVLYQSDDQYYEYTGNFGGFWNTFLDAIDGSYCTYAAFNETGDCTAYECADPVYPDPNEGGYKGALQCGVYEPTNVISISYAATEPDFPDYYMERQCSEWMKLVLQGTTIVMSSGDYGVGGFGDGCPTSAAGEEVFYPLFASTCPYVLSVGSTEWDRLNASAPVEPWEKLNEVATTRFYSGGGFSNVFGVPDYQVAAVDGYFDQAGSELGFDAYDQFVANGNFSTVAGGVYNRGGRAYPDVGAIGDRQVVYAGGEWYRVGGTSLSAPIWGAVLTLVNEARIAAGKSTLGFIHPVLYEHPEVFNDVTVGSNPGCDTGGFIAASGWDPVTGLGSPNYPVLLDLLLTL